MFKKLFGQRTKVPSALQKIVSTEVDKYFNFPLTAKFCPKTFHDDISKVLNDVFNSTDKIASLRVEIAKAMRAQAHWQALALTAAEKQDAFYATSELFNPNFAHRLDTICENISILRNAGICDADNELLVVQCNRRGLLFLAKMNILNLARAFTSDDASPRTDWFKKCYLAELIIAEHDIRTELKEPTAISDVDKIALALLNEQYLVSSFTPYADWKAALKDYSPEVLELGM
ncbi:hypothetical protein N9X06_06650 [Paracoccaceae bacterium]|nr:hypothetical protein [Paracoccaceae bacterium]